MILIETAGVRETVANDYSVSGPSQPERLPHRQTDITKEWVGVPPHTKRTARTTSQNMTATTELHNRFLDQTRTTGKKALAGFGANRAQNFTRRPLTRKALSGTGTHYLIRAFLVRELGDCGLGPGFCGFRTRPTKPSKRSRNAELPSGRPVRGQKGTQLFYVMRAHLSPPFSACLAAAA